MSVEAMWRRPVCVGGIVCYAGFFSVLPLRHNVKNILEGNALTSMFFLMTPSDESLKKGKELLVHSPCLSADVGF